MALFLITLGTLQLLSQQRHGDKIFNCSNFSSWQAFKCERMNTNTLKYTSAGPGWSCRGRGRRGSPSSPKWSVLILCWYTRQHRKPPKQPGLCLQKFYLFCILACFRLWTGFMKYFSATATATVATPWIGNNKFTV